jgi:hypothetical protein
MIANVALDVRDRRRENQGGEGRRITIEEAISDTVRSARTTLPGASLSVGQAWWRVYARSVTDGPGKMGVIVGPRVVG